MFESKQVRPLMQQSVYRETHKTVESEEDFKAILYVFGFLCKQTVLQKYIKNQLTR